MQKTTIIDKEYHIINNKLFDPETSKVAYFTVALTDEGGHWVDVHTFWKLVKIKLLQNHYKDTDPVKYQIYKEEERKNLDYGDLILNSHICYGNYEDCEGGPLIQDM